jgi:hypothetical protein
MMLLGLKPIGELDVTHVSGADGGVRLMMLLGLKHVGELVSRTSLVRTEAFAS